MLVKTWLIIGTINITNIRSLFVRIPFSDTYVIHIYIEHVIINCATVSVGTQSPVAEYIQGWTILVWTRRKFGHLGSGFQWCSRTYPMVRV